MFDFVVQGKKVHIHQCMIALKVDSPTPTYVDNGSRLSVLEAHVLGSSANDAERSNVMDIQHQLELLVCCLVSHGIERVSCIVDNDVDLSKGPAT